MLGWKKTISLLLIFYELFASISFTFVSLFLYISTPQKLQYFIGQWAIDFISIILALLALRVEWQRQDKSEKRQFRKHVGYCFLLLETVGRFLSIGFVFLLPEVESSTAQFVWIHFLWGLGTGITMWVVLMGLFGYKLFHWFYRQFHNDLVTTDDKPMKRDSLVVKKVSLPQPDIDDYHIVMIPPSVNSVKNLPGSRIEKMSILTSVFETNKSSDVPLHVPFGSPIPPTPTGTPIPNIDSDVGSVSEHSIVQVKNSSDTSLAYSDWNGDHRWETYRIRPVEVLQVRDVSPLRVSFDS